MDFAPAEAPRIAYASSFVYKEIKEPYFSIYAKHLSRYCSITVRELSGVGIVKEMTGKDANVVCDPTMLLSAQEWHHIADVSNVDVSQRYILVYLLRYMFDSRPGFNNIVESVRISLGLPVFHINSYTQDMFHPHVKFFKGIGSSDFVKLVMNASFMITDSFHGAAFASLFNIPMIDVVKDMESGGGRIMTLCERVSGLTSIVNQNANVSITDESLGAFCCNAHRYNFIELDQLINLAK